MIFRFWKIRNQNTKHGLMCLIFQWLLCCVCMFSMGVHTLECAAGLGSVIFLTWHTQEHSIQHCIYIHRVEKSPINIMWCFHCTLSTKVWRLMPALLLDLYVFSTPTTSLSPDTGGIWEGLWENVTPAELLYIFSPSPTPHFTSPLL